MTTNNMQGRNGRGFMRRALHTGATITVAGVLLSACAIQPTPLTQEETDARIESDFDALFSEQDPIDGPITLQEAMARAVMYNLDHRLQVLEEALSQRQLDVARYDLLPRLVAEAGYNSRSNFNASSSQDVVTGQQSLRPSTSQERDIFTADLNFAWNVLDFGVSYYTAHQQADRAMIAYERRRRVIHGIIQDVRSAYWRTVAAERLKQRAGDLLERLEQARGDSQRIEQLRLQSPLDALNYQRVVLESKRQLQTLRQDLALGKIELATLMNLAPDRDFELAMPEDSHPLEPPAMEPGELEQLALAYRPELREEDYQARISAAQTRKSLLRLLPGIEFHTGYHHNSNDFLVNNEWSDYGLRVTWNLLGLLGAPQRLEQAQTEEQIVAARRQALSMAVLTQLYVSYTSYQQARELLETNEDAAKVDRRIVTQLRRNEQARSKGQLATIRGELEALIGGLRRDLAFARAQNALGQLYLTVGADPLPEEIGEISVAALAQAIKDTQAGWQKGQLFMRSTLLDVGAEQGLPSADDGFDDRF